MSAPDGGAPLIAEFAALDGAQIGRLEAAGSHFPHQAFDDRALPPLRGGCAPPLLLGAAAIFGPVAVAESAPLGVVIVIAGVIAGKALLDIVRSVRAARRSREMLRARDVRTWPCVAWGPQGLLLRSFGRCLLVRWEGIDALRYLDAGFGRALGETLWLHAGRERILFPEHDGRFAGRTRAEWFAALAPPWEAATGRKSERPIAKGSQQT